MEPAKIDWRTIDSEFEPDETYEHINAPQWIDFLASSPLHRSPRDDGSSWFCRPDCDHPRTAADYLKSRITASTSGSSSKMMFRSASVSKLIGLGDWTSREGNLKKRGTVAQSSTPPATDECGENQDPNVQTPTCLTKSVKAAIKSSAEKKWQDDNYTEIMLRSNEKPRLKSTLSARDLFGGREIISKVSEFCYELKRMVRRMKQEDAGANLLNIKSGSATELLKNDVMVLAEKEKLDEEVKVCEPLIEVGREKHDEEKAKERKPLLEVGSGKSKIKRKKRVDDAENIAPSRLDLNVIKGEDQKALLQIRTSPPTPQCFSAARDQSNTTPPKAPKSRLKEEKILEDVKKNKLLSEELEENSSRTNASPSTTGRKRRDASPLDVLWFFKPCTLAS
ncbi:hypothetical protein Droror1_Dr00024435 [Drosera rotundifolia]